MGQDYRTDIPDSIKGSAFTLIDPRAGKFATGVGDKRALIANAPKTRKLLLAWSGQWKTDIFTLTAGEAASRMS